MMAGKKGYRDILDFSGSDEMRMDYFGIIARGDRYFLSHFVNVNKGKHILVELTKEKVEELQKDFEKGGWSFAFFKKWIAGVIV